MNKKTLAILLVLVLGLSLFAACTPAQTPPAQQPAQQQPAAQTPATPAVEEDEQIFRIGVSLPPILNDFHSSMREFILEAIENAPPNFEFTVVGAADEGDQVNVLEQFYGENFDGVVISAFNGTIVAPITEAIYKSGTPVIVINRAIDTEYFTAFVACDNEGGARVAAHRVAEVLGGEGTVIVMQMVGGTPIDNARTYPFIEVMETYYPDIEILAVVVAGQSRESGHDFMQNAMMAHPVINALYSGAEEAIYGALHAARLAGRDEVKIGIGFGASSHMWREIDQNPDTVLELQSYLPIMGADAIRAMIYYLQGGTLERYHLRDSIVLNRDNLADWRDLAF